ncbi:MAG TPA: deoxyribodipyrimidine photo-lyase [Ignavibacteriaceae bacterium]|nr:deoxyribodipyrimidine photo-lyase [Ignavibacteriaceae bacterium]
MEIKEHRIQLLKNGNEGKGPVLYWMSRDQRVHDNYALLFTQQLALQKNRPLGIVFNITPNFLDASIRQYAFMLKGLKVLVKELNTCNIPFFLLLGEPFENLPAFIKQCNASLLVTDFDPLRIKQKWKRMVAEQINIPFYEVDAHNIIPCQMISKKEYAAFTIRPKIHRHIPEYLSEFPELAQMGGFESFSQPAIDWKKVEQSLNINRKVKEVDWIIPGEKAALESLKYFLENKLDHYSEDRNDPVKDAQSNLSPYIHFGQISAQRIALEVKKYGGNPDSERAFLEELIVRKELADNFCFYNPDYDSFKGFPDWAKETLSEHKDDNHDFIYTKEQFERAQTHDDLWNAAQNELIKTGKMHGYMRMYWAKKILEWTNTPQYALKISIYLNDKYELDGRDPNGYAGCAWSIGGVHDRPWPERDIFGSIRYMSRKGVDRKFDVSKYIFRFK